MLLLLQQQQPNCLKRNWCHREESEKYGNFAPTTTNIRQFVPVTPVYVCVNGSTEGAGRLFAKAMRLCCLK